MVGHHGSDGRVAGGDIEVHQPPVKFGNRLPVLPPRADVEGQARTHPPIVSRIAVVIASAEVFVGVSEGE